mgnify:CR=1 FL=1
MTHALGSMGLHTLNQSAFHADVPTCIACMDAELLSTRLLASLLSGVARWVGARLRRPSSVFSADSGRFSSFRSTRFFSLGIRSRGGSSSCHVLLPLARCRRSCSGPATCGIHANDASTCRSSRRFFSPRFCLTPSMIPESSFLTGSTRRPFATMSLRHIDIHPSYSHV